MLGSLNWNRIEVCNVVSHKKIALGIFPNKVSLEELLTVLVLTCHVPKMLLQFTVMVWYIQRVVKLTSKFFLSL